MRKKVTIASAIGLAFLVAYLGYLSIATPATYDLVASKKQCEEAILAEAKQLPDGDLEADAALQKKTKQTCGELEKKVDAVNRVMDGEG